ncbi:cytochrome c biogenesis protein ResB [Denitratisoma oestradiolicum]|uniref:ResB-like domain-containing protein n=1 Tax=Denitratisoma oestradiolicum TaxID=311182 RepID=A0A6S6XP36_9PROT|nr:cytochrome c biogenesis protein ResB [Denitratisoma oestradiolicum]TWO80639.1 hypothetical protein CBW56_09395 [Denitratisoma oestradiolicum]CAB1367721.1 conserved membrane protein of unknown function [Denitratisoma oestradiolicum]
MGVLQLLASLKLTLVILLLLGVSVTLAYFSAVRTSPGLVLSLGLLAVNLLASIATNAKFRRQTPLLVFHLALLVIVLLVALGRMTYLKGQTEVVAGEEFAGQLSLMEAGPWHDGGIERVRFTNLGFRIPYGPDLRRLSTENRVRWVAPDGRVQEQTIGDHRPLVISHYRFYANWNKGFTLLFRWHPVGGAPVAGAVNLPGYPANSRQAQRWSLPGTDRSVWALLQFDEELIPESGGEFRLPSRHEVILRTEDQRWVLMPGGHIDLPQGRLEYLGLSTWMGYSVSYDRTLPWLLAAAVLAVLALAWHFQAKFAARPWNP